MCDVANRRRGLPGYPFAALSALALALVLLGTSAPACAGGKLSWLDDVVREVVRDAETSSKAVVKGGDGASTALRGSTRLFAHEGDEGLEVLLKRSDDLARALEAARPNRRRKRCSTAASLDSYRMTPTTPARSRRSRRRRNGWWSRWAKPRNDSPPAIPARPSR